ncbi:MAG: hypothetical protein E2585_20410 [Comamonas sp.]|nr:hypothetical protein [Comamonas sp.]
MHAKDERDEFRLAAAAVQRSKFLVGCAQLPAECRVCAEARGGARRRCINPFEDGLPTAPGKYRLINERRCASLAGCHRFACTPYSHSRQKRYRGSCRPSHTGPPVVTRQCGHWWLVGLYIGSLDHNAR